MSDDLAPQEVALQQLDSRRPPVVVSCQGEEHNLCACRLNSAGRQLRLDIRQPGIAAGPAYLVQLRSDKPV